MPKRRQSLPTEHHHLATWFSTWLLGFPVGEIIFAFANRDGNMPGPVPTTGGYRMRAIRYLVLPLCFSTALMAEAVKEPKKSSKGTSDVAPVILVADGLNADGSLIDNYQRGLRYAIDYFGNHGPYYIYLLGPNSEQSVREIYDSSFGTPRTSSASAGRLLVSCARLKRRRCKKRSRA